MLCVSSILWNFYIFLFVFFIHGMYFVLGSHNMCHSYTLVYFYALFICLVVEEEVSGRMCAYSA